MAAGFGGAGLLLLPVLVVAGPGFLATPGGLAHGASTWPPSRRRWPTCSSRAGCGGCPAARRRRSSSPSRSRRRRSASSPSASTRRPRRGRRAARAGRAARARGARSPPAARGRGGAGMTATALRRASTVDQLTAVLRERILEGDLEPGRRLIERELVEAYEVARHTLRAALRQLEVEGLVRVEPNRGARVAMLSGDELTELFALRLALEREAAHLALERGDGRLPAAVHEAAQRLQRLALRRRSTWSELSRAHHAVHAGLVARRRRPADRARLLRAEHRDRALRQPAQAGVDQGAGRGRPRRPRARHRARRARRPARAHGAGAARPAARRLRPDAQGGAAPLRYSGDSSFSGGMRHLPLLADLGQPCGRPRSNGPAIAWTTAPLAFLRRVDDGQQRIDARLGAELRVDRELAADDLVVAGVDADAVDPVARGCSPWHENESVGTTCLVVRSRAKTSVSMLWAGICGWI